MKNQLPLVSILMPYYKFPDYFREAVKSVQCQTHSNWELIVVDDKSPECPAQEALAGIDDSRIKVFRHEENRGTAAGRNTAASHSQGELLIPLDADDKLAPQYIERTLKAMCDADASAAYSDVQIFGMHSLVYKPSSDLADIFTGHYPHNTLLMKRELFDAVGGYRKFGYIEDTAFWVSIIELGKPFAYVPEPLYFFRRHLESASRANSHTIAKDFYLLLQRHQESMAAHLPTIITKWIEMAEKRRVAAAAATDMQPEYEHLQKDFHSLLSRYKALEKQNSRNEQVLSSLSSLARHMSYLSLKKLGMR
jgi:glycosyltransferase involved in cell wall biosynthesis